MDPIHSVSVQTERKDAENFFMPFRELIQVP